MEIPDEILRKIKIMAASRGTTVRALVTEGLENFVREEEMVPADRAARVFEVMDEVAEYSAGARLTREEAHER